METLNSILRTAFDLVMQPLHLLPAWVGVTVVSLLGGVGALIVYKYTSNQAALEAVKDKIAASFFEIRLFNDDLKAILRAQWDLLRNNLKYFVLNLVPMLVMIVPFVLVIAQLQFHYGYEPLDNGQPVVVKAELAEGVDGTAVELEVPDGVRLDAPPVWSPQLSEVAWRLVPERPGRYELQVRYGDERLTKTLDSEAGLHRRSPQRLEPGLVNQLLYPAEPPLPKDGAVRAIEIPYHDAEIDFGILGMHWLIAFLLLSIVFAFALRKRLGVTL